MATALTLYLKSQNDDSTAAVRPTSSSDRLASNLVPSTRPRITNQPAPDARTTGASSKPEPLRATMRTNFARLDTDASDDIIDDDEPLSPPNLGKRIRTEPIKEDHANSRRTRLVRLV